MILYLYALADRVERLDGLAGVGDEPLVQIETANARLVAGWIAAPPAIDRLTLEAQDRVIRALHDRAGALLPMRFGTAVDGVDAAVRAVSIVARTLPERFDLVRGREQMTVRVLRTRGAGARGAESAEGDLGAGALGAEGARRDSGAVALGAEGAEPLVAVQQLQTTNAEAVGTSYLRSRAMKDTPTEIAPLLDVTRTIARATRVERGEHRAVVATVYQLIDRDRSPEYVGRVRGAGAAMAALTLRVSGPSPAYAFARE